MESGVLTIITTVLQRTLTTQLHISLKKSQNHIFVDVRTFELKDGEYQPTKKGVTVPIRLLDDLIENLQKVRKKNGKTFT